jgi:hypothetical protein
LSSWCTAAEVDARVQGTPPTPLLTEFAEQATSILYVLSGRRFGGEATVVSTHEIDRRGYVKLTDWAPVRDVTTATIDGAEVAYALSPAGTYVVFPPQYVRQVVVLTLEVGQNPPAAGRNAAAALAAEMLRGDPRYVALGDYSDTRPASRITSISRQGVSYSFADPGGLAEKNLTGVYEVDLFLRAANPNGMRHQPKVVTA